VSAPAVSIVYDGECPFCSSYVELVRLREAVGTVELINARDDHPLVAEMERRGFDLDQGMAMRVGDEYLHGAAVLQRIAELSAPQGFANRIQARLFADHARAARLYPMLRAGRNLVLRLLGRKPIAATRGKVNTIH
jgi:predicted DCC family thiol-disulfide oxidoreductase YuxK